MDLYNGETIAFKISKCLTLDIDVEPLNVTISIIIEHTLYQSTTHSDYGWNYQHHSWVKTLKQHEAFFKEYLEKNYLDNSQMEKFFGIFKQDKYYAEDRGSYDLLKTRIEDCIYYYDHTQLKIKLSHLPPMAYRK